MNFEKPSVPTPKPEEPKKDLLEGAVIGRHSIMTPKAAEQLTERLKGFNLGDVEVYLRNLGTSESRETAEALRDYPEDVAILQEALDQEIQPAYDRADVLHDEHKKDQLNILRHVLERDIDRLRAETQKLSKQVGDAKVYFERAYNYPIALPPLDKLRIEDLRVFANGMWTLRNKHLIHDKRPGYEKNAEYRKQVQELSDQYKNLHYLLP